MTEERECDQTRNVIPELAAGVALGDERAAALRHVATCGDCQRELAAASAVVDELVLLVPPQEPPAGFEDRVLARIAPRSRRVSRWRGAGLRFAVLVTAVALTAGAVWQATADDRRVAGSYRKTLAVANGSYLTAAGFYTSHVRVGHVFAYQGSPSWLFLTIESNKESGTYDVWLITRQGRRLNIGSMTIIDGRGSWGTTIDQPVAQVAQVLLQRPGAADLTARLH